MTRAAEQARVRPAEVCRDPRPLHLVKRGQHPVALCGAHVTESWDPTRGAAGRDRCTDCLTVLRNLNAGVN
jgi:hypothetical protein